METILHFGSETCDDEYIVIVDGQVMIEDQEEHRAEGFKLLSALSCDIPSCSSLPIDRPLRSRGAWHLSNRGKAVRS